MPANYQYTLKLSFVSGSLTPDHLIDCFLHFDD